MIYPAAHTAVDIQLQHHHRRHHHSMTSIILRCCCGSSRRPTAALTLHHFPVKHQRGPNVARPRRRRQAVTVRLSRPEVKGSDRHRSDVSRPTSPRQAERFRYDELAVS